MSGTEFTLPLALPLAREPALLIRRIMFLNGFRPVVVVVVGEEEVGRGGWFEGLVGG